MFPKRWVRAVILAIVAVISVTLGFLIVRGPIRQQIVVQSAQRSFGQQKLNLLILGYQADEVTTDTIILAHLDVGRRTATLVSIPRDTWVPIPGAGLEQDQFRVRLRRSACHRESCQQASRRRPRSMRSWPCSPKVQPRSSTRWAAST